jgi:hypothetical protein
VFDEDRFSMTLSSSPDDPQEPAAPVDRWRLPTTARGASSVEHTARFAEPARREPFVPGQRLPLQTREAA